MAVNPSHIRLEDLFGPDGESLASVAIVSTIQWLEDIGIEFTAEQRSLIKGALWGEADPPPLDELTRHLPKTD